MLLTKAHLLLHTQYWDPVPRPSLGTGHPGSATQQLVSSQYSQMTLRFLSSRTCYMITPSLQTTFLFWAELVKQSVLETLQIEMVLVWMHRNVDFEETDGVDTHVLILIGSLSVMIYLFLSHHTPVMWPILPVVNAAWMTDCVSAADLVVFAGSCFAVTLCVF